MAERHHDFFISYTSADQAWAEWIAWTLEGAGYSTVIQAWDFRPGSNFVLEIQQAATEANRTIAIMSQKYLESTFTKPEWAALFAQDPQGKKQKLIPVRIDACQLTGLLAPIVYLDLVGLLENDARTALLGAFRIRNKPASEPAFPGSVPPTPRVSPPQPSYPGVAETISRPIAEILSSVAEGSDQSRRLSASQRLQFMRQSPQKLHGTQAGPTQKPFFVSSGLALDQKMRSELHQLHEWARDRWESVQRQLKESGAIRCAHNGRVVLVDKLVRKLANSIEQVFQVEVGEGALVARGGYGAGYLSFGSDIDITFIHGEEGYESPPAFYTKFNQWLYDLCGLSKTVTAAPMIGTVDDCLKDWGSWRDGSDPKKLQAFVSFAESRFVHGDQRFHARIVEKWTSFSAALSADDVHQLASLLRARGDKLEIDVDTQDGGFNLKSHAGGITECRLVNFLKRVIAARGVPPPPESEEFSEAETFMLMLREGVHSITSSHVLFARDLKKLRQKMQSLINAPIPITAGSVIAHRRAIRAQLDATVKYVADFRPPD